MKNGDLTQKHEDAALAMLNDNLDKLIDGNFGPGGPEGFGAHGGPKGFGPGLAWGWRMAPQKFADFLGITLDQLKTELQADGATIANVAEAHGKSRDQLKTFITDSARAKTRRSGEERRPHAEA